MARLFSNDGRPQRSNRVRKRIFARSTRPRLSVFRSNKHIYAQVIDDSKRCTVVSACSLEGANKESLAKSKVAEMVGSSVAEKAMKAGIKEVVFDRGGFSYHGRIKSLADAARKKGLKF